jgi:hypothetical protein
MCLLTVSQAEPVRSCIHPHGLLHRLSVAYRSMREMDSDWPGHALHYIIPTHPMLQSAYLLNYCFAFLDLRYYIQAVIDCRGELVISTIDSVNDLCENDRPTFNNCFIPGHCEPGIPEGDEIEDSRKTLRFERTLQFAKDKKNGYNKLTLTYQSDRMGGTEAQTWRCYIT